MNDTDLVLLDTNVLLSATDSSRSRHAAAVELLEEDPRDLAISPQIVREYLAVATRPTTANGLGLAADLAVVNVRRLLASLRLLPEGSASTARLLDLLGDVTVAGRQVHDAHVVAVALTHGAEALVTDDARHFQRFSDLLIVESLG